MATVKVFTNEMDGEPKSMDIGDVDEVNNDDGVFVVVTEKTQYFFPHSSVHHIEATDLE